MKITKTISGLIGIFLPLLIGKSFEIPEGIALVWICIFCFGFIGKLLLQAFDYPFISRAVNPKLQDNHLKNLNFASSVFTFLGLGAVVGELVFFQAIGALPISLLIFGISIHLSARYTNGRNWFFNQ